MTVEPRTEAGKWLLSDLREQRVATVDDPARIAAIESEARAAALREVAEKVRAIDPTFAHDGTDVDRFRSDVLAILTEATGASE